MVDCTDSYHFATIQGHRKFLASRNYCQTYKEGLTDYYFLDHKEGNLQHLVVMYFLESIQIHYNVENNLLYFSDEACGLFERQ